MALVLFDTAVNVGRRRVSGWLQHALNTRVKLLRPDMTPLKPDGLLGEKSLRHMAVAMVSGGG